MLLLLWRRRVGDGLLFGLSFPLLAFPCRFLLGRALGLRMLRLRGDGLFEGLPRLLDPGGQILELLDGDVLAGLGGPFEDRRQIVDGRAGVVVAFRAVPELGGLADRLRERFARVGLLFDGEGPPRRRHQRVRVLIGLARAVLQRSSIPDGQPGGGLVEYPRVVRNPRVQTAPCLRVGEVGRLVGFGEPSRNRIGLPQHGLRLFRAVAGGRGDGAGGDHADERHGGDHGEHRQYDPAGMDRTGGLIGIHIGAESRDRVLVHVIQVIGWRRVVGCRQGDRMRAGRRGSRHIATGPRS